jgi:uncharacterized protein YndB with AHSA1/START domain
MKSNEKTNITVVAKIDAPVDMVWKYWTTPEDIVRWNNASEDWFTPRAENDLRTGGKFLSRMEARDGSSGFDFWGTYTDIKTCELIEYTLGDERKVKITFSAIDNKTEIVETFEAENTYTVDQQRIGWQSILNNFKKYAESKTHST